VAKETNALRQLGLITLTCIFAIPLFADSQVRIVRLSQVDGTAEIDRNTGQGFEKAFLNLPITQGMKIRTRHDGRVEVEFEDGSALRLTPDTEVEFPRLSSRESGGRVSQVVLRKGFAYLNFKAGKDDQFTLNFGRERVSLNKPVHLRVEVDDEEAKLAVFNGDVMVEDPSGTLALGKRQTATFDLMGQDRYLIAKEVEPSLYDDWDKQEDKYHDQYAATSGSYSPYGYGVSDLSYYGTYFSVPGYGLCWQPYFVGFGWDPFMNGSWMWYPGFGYTWVSAYPWGWTPYRYGTWFFMAGRGWVWSPGNSWAGWNTAPRVINAPHGFVAPKPPVTPGQTVLVNRGPLPTLVGSRRGLLIRNDSAALGIQRGSLRNLRKVSEQVQQRGAVTERPHSTVMSISPTGTAGFAGPGRIAGPQMGAGARSTATPHSAATPHAGSAPAAHSSGGPHK
jgi:FecR protein